jgi:hypothetical protein
MSTNSYPEIVTSEIEEYQLVHNFFGGVHAPGNADYTIKRTCIDNATLFHPEVVKTGLRHAYVDDILRSTVWDTANIIVQQIFEMFEKGGLSGKTCDQFS